jgi:hypothetical protein
MSKGRSYKNDTWSSFEKQSYSLINDDFVHSKLVTIKANVPAVKGGINLKETLATKGDGVTSTGEAKIWFQLTDGHSMYAKIQPKNLLFHYDNGIQIKNNQMWNFYGALSTNRQIDDNQVRVGAEVFSPTGDWSCSNMIQYTQSGKGNNLQFLHKGYSLHDQKKCVFNNYTTLNITKRAVEQIALLAGYRGWGSVSNDIFVRYELEGFSNAKEFQNSLWEKNKLTVDWINGKKGSFVHGIEVILEYNLVLKQHQGDCGLPM